MPITINGLEYGDANTAKRVIAEIEQQEQMEADLLNEIRRQAVANMHANLALFLRHAERMKDGRRDDWTVFHITHAPSEVARGGPRRWDTIYHTKHGSGIGVHYGKKPVALLNSNDGKTIAVELIDKTWNRTEWLVIGCHKGETAFYELPYFLHPDTK